MRRRTGREAACELLADYADRWKGPAPTPPQRLADAWGECSAAEQRDILDSLASRLREAYQTVAAVGGSASIAMDVDLRGTVGNLCADAWAALLAMVAADPEPWQAPECARCRGLIAAGLCSLIVQLHVAVGFSPGAVAQAARVGAEVTSLGEFPQPRQSPETM